MGWQTMDVVFSPEVLAELTAAVDRQLREVQMQPIDPSRSGMDEVQALRSQLAMQTAAIAQVTQEPADSFLRHCCTNRGLRMRCCARV
jgi:hypothetical protein